MKKIVNPKGEIGISTVIDGNINSPISCQQIKWTENQKEYS
jgi:hypothetical protein